MPRKIIGDIGDFHEMSIIPGWTTSRTTYDKVDLSVELAPGVILDKPFIAAAMTSVVGPELTLACANNGTMAVVPSQLSIEDASSTIRDAKNQEVKRGDLELVKQPERIKDDRTIGEAIDKYNSVGHSVIPVCDDYRNLKALFLYQEGIPRDFFDISLSNAIKMARGRKQEMRKIIKPFDIKRAKYGADYCWDTDKPRKVHKLMMKGKKRRCMPIVDRKGVMKGLSFVYKYNGYAVGGAIHTYKWEERAEALLDAGADIIFIDSSDGASDFQVRTIKKFKKMYPDTPICAGNVVASVALEKNRTGKVVEVPVYDALVDAGADIIKIGMGSGRICLTTENRGPGRRLLRALNDLYEARANHSEYRPFIADGGIGTVDPDMNKRARVRKNMRQDTRSIDLALAFADAVMMGSYFNMFEEAAGPEQPIDGKRYKESWGEGSFKAKTVARYDVYEAVRRAYIEEGSYNLIPCIGRLKPGIERTALGVAMTLSNVGAANLADYRKLCVLEEL